MSRFFFRRLLLTLACLGGLSPAVQADTTSFSVRVPVVAVTHVPTTVAVDYGNVLVGTSAARTVTFTNRSSDPTKLISVTTQGKPVLISANTCAPNLQLDPQKSCTLTATLAPTAVGPWDGSIAVSHTAGATPDIYNLHATGVDASTALKFDLSWLEFGKQGVQTDSAARTLTLRNSSTRPVAIAAVSLADNSTYFHIDTNTCETTLQPGGACQVGVVFSPRLLGVASSRVLLTLEDGSRLYGATVSGTGVQGVASWSASTVNFTGLTIGQASAVQTVTLTNSGTGTLTLDELRLSGDDSFKVPSITCQKTLEPQQSCQIDVQVTPLDKDSRTASLTLTASKALTPITKVQFFSQPSLSESRLEWSTSTLDFGEVTVGSTASKSLTLRSAGNQAITVTKYTLAGLNNGDFSLVNSGSCLGTLAPGMQCSFSVQATPRADGAREALVDPDGTSTVPFSNVSLRVRGLAGRLTAGPAVVSLPLTNIGATSTAVVTLTNEGSAAVTVQPPAISTAAAGTVSAAGCANVTLAANQTCAVTLTYTGKVAGAFNGSVTWSHNGVGGAAVVAVSASTAAPAAPEGALDAFVCTPSPVQAATPSVCSATLRNTGTVPMSVGMMSRTNTAFGAPSSSCTASLAPGASCKVNVSITPATAGEFSTQVNVATGVGNLSGVARVVAQVPTATLTMQSHGVVMAGSPDVRAHTLANTGTLPVVVSIPAYLTTGAPFSLAGSPTVATTCKSGQSLDVGQSCQVVTTCAPTSAGKFSSVMRIYSTAGTLTGNVDCTGALPAPTGSQLQVSPNPASFGDVTIGSVIFKTLTVTNTGFTNVAISAIKVSGYDAGVFNLYSSTGCIRTLTPNSSCTLILRAAVGTTGARQASLDFTTNAPTPMPSVALSLNGVAGTLSAAPGAYDFGQVALRTTKSASFTIQNTGNATLQVNTVQVTGKVAGTFTASSNNCTGTSLLPGQSCVVGVTFAPQTSPVTSGELRVTSISASNGFVSVPLTGEGLVPPTAAGTLTAQGDCNSTVLFGKTVTCTLVLKSTGTADLVVSGYTLRRTAGDFLNAMQTVTTARAFEAVTGGSYDTATGRLTLPPGASASLPYVLYPYAVGYSTTVTGVGAYQSLTTSPTNSVTLQSNAPVAIVGSQLFKVTAPVFTVQATPQALNPQFKQPQEGVATIRNSGTGVVRLNAAPQVSAGTYTPWFGLGTSTCSQGASLQPGQACTVAVTCTPSLMGTTVSGSLQVNTAVDFETPSATLLYPVPQRATFSCTGTAARVTITPSYGSLTSNIATGSQSGNWRRVTNAGSGPVTVLGLAGSSDFLLYTDTAQTSHCNANTVLQPGKYCDFLEIVLRENPSPFPVTSAATHLVKTDAGTFSWLPNYSILGPSLTTLGALDGSIQRGSSRTVTVLLNNIAPSALSDLQFVTSTGTTVQSTTCSTVAPGATCQVVLLVTPAADSSASYYNATLELRGRFNRVLNGQAQGPAAMATVARWNRSWMLTAPLVPQTPIVCGQCKTGVGPGQYVDFDVPIYNGGKEPIVFAGPPRIDGDVYFTIIKTTCQLALEAGHSCQPTVRFAPVPGVFGTRNARLIVPTSGGNLYFPLTAYAMPRASVSISTSSSNPSPALNTSTDYSTVVRNTSPDGASAPVTISWKDTVTPTTSATPAVSYAPPTCLVTGVGSTCTISGNTATMYLAPGGTGTIRQHIAYGIVPCKHSRSTSALVNGVWDDNLDDNSSNSSFEINRGGLVTNSNGARLWQDGSAAASCQAYLAGDAVHAYAGATGSGMYMVDYDGNGPLQPTAVWCDMTTDGGGWTCPHSEDSAVTTQKWVSPVDDKGLVYNQLLMWAGAEHYMDYAVPVNNNSWDSKGFTLAKTMLQFDTKTYTSRSTPAWRGCGADEAGAVSIPGRTIGYLPDSAYRNLAPESTCFFGGANVAGQCSDLMTVNVPYAGARLRAVGDLESFAGQCTGDNLIRKQYSICFRNNPSVVPAEVTAPSAGIIQVGSTRTWFDTRLATSCRAYRQGDGGGGHSYTGATGDGTYRIDADGPGPVQPVDVWCDMTSDNGAGYTELPINTIGALHARDAETWCANSGLQLFVPRTNAHFAAARAHFGTENFALMGIYPKWRGATCMGSQFNSGGCSGWGPLNGGGWFVQSGLNVSEPNGDNDTDGSMLYSYSNGNVSWYNDLFDSNGGGYTSNRIMCSARDEGGVAAGHYSPEQPKGPAYDVGRNNNWAYPQYGAVWMWPAQGAANNDMGSYACLQGVVNNSYGGSIGLTIGGAADNQADIYIDEQRVGSFPTYSSVTNFSTTLPPGRHVIKARVSNAGGPAGVTLWGLRQGTAEVVFAASPTTGWTACQ